MNKDFQKIIMQAETLNNYPVEDMILELINASFYDLGLEPVTMDKVSFQAADWDNLIYGKVVLMRDKYYDLISTHEKGYCSIEYLFLSLSNSVKLPNGFRLDGDVLISCYLPQDDVDLFEAMGKIHTEVEPQTVRKSIICGV